MVMISDLAKHRVMRVKIQIYVIVQRPSAGDLLCSAPILHFAHSNRFVFVMASQGMAQNPVLQNGRNVCNRRDVVQLFDFFASHLDYPDFTKWL